MNDFGLLIAKYSSSLPTLVDGQMSSLQVDTNGRLLVQADVSVIIDALGLNGAADNSNIIIVGTEDGTGTGTKHAVRVTSNGTVVTEVSNTVTVQATNLDIRDLVFATDKVDVSGSNVTVSATDLDIRDLSHLQDSVKVGDGVEFLAINADGSINITDNGGSITVDASDLDIRDLSHTQDSIKIGDGSEFFQVAEEGDAPKKGIQALSFKDSAGNLVLPQLNAAGEVKVAASIGAPGSEAYAATDALAAGGDGLVTITAAGTPWVTAASMAVGAGQTMYLYGYEWSCDANADCRIISDDGTNIVVYKRSFNSSSMPTIVSMFGGESARIEIPGSATMNVRIQIRKRAAAGGDAVGFGSMHTRII